MTPQTLIRSGLMLQRWQRIGLGVRLAYNPWYPAVIRCYLVAGNRLVRAQVQPDEAVQRCMLKLLLQTAEDEALPWAWRCACQEHAVFPLARLATLARQAQAAPPTTWLERTDAIGERLAQLQPGEVLPHRRH